MLTVDLTAGVGRDFGAAGALQNLVEGDFGPMGRVVCSPWEGLYLEQAHGVVSTA